MSVPTFDPPMGPSPGTAHKPVISLWKSDFGDGYSQPTPKGLNHIRKSVTQSWKTLTIDQMREIMEFFELDRQGYLPFYYTPFGEFHAIKWTCEDWSSSTDEGIWNVTAVFNQDFSVAP